MEPGLHQFVRNAVCHENVLDLVTSNDSQFISTIDVLRPISISYHNVIHFRPNISLSDSSNNQFSKVAPYDFLRANYYNLTQYLYTINWNDLFEYCFSVGDYWSEFRYQIELAIQAHVPKLRRTKPKKRHPSFIYKMIRTKSKLWKTWKCGQNFGDKIRNCIFAKTCRNSITKYFSSLERNMLRS